MTYEEIIDVCDAVFEEYLPEVKKKARRVFLDELLTELEVNEVLVVTSDEPDLREPDNDFSLEADE